MRKTRIIIILLLIITVAVAVLFLYPQLGKKNTGEKVEVKSVVIATQDIPLNTTITEEMLTTKEYPAAYAPVSAYENREEIIGLTAIINIRKNDVVRTSDVLGAGETARKLSLNIPKGMRAMSVQVDAVSGIADLIKVGDHVDVVAVLSNGEQNVATVHLQNIEVLALDRVMADDPAADGTSSYDTVTLCVMPEDTEKLALAMCDGTVYLTLRTEGDEMKVSVKNFSAADIKK